MSAATAQPLPRDGTAPTSLLREAVRSWRKRHVSLREFYLGATLLPFMAVLAGVVVFLIVFVTPPGSLPDFLGPFFNAVAMIAYMTLVGLPAYSLSLVVLYRLGRRVRTPGAMHATLLLFPFVVALILCVVAVPVAGLITGEWIVAGFSRLFVMALVAGYAYVLVVLTLLAVNRITGRLREQVE